MSEAESQSRRPDAEDQHRLSTLVIVQGDEVDGEGPGRRVGWLPRRSAAAEGLAAEGDQQRNHGLYVVAAKDDLVHLAIVNDDLQADAAAVAARIARYPRHDRHVAILSHR
ncbi:hypothetical protein [Methylobacterium oryzae]|uniref:hypothetical protein n=1 Tax=Methylobacterium oryzae TaxID=334852 RepID=UPI002F34F87F